MARKFLLNATAITALLVIVASGPASADTLDFTEAGGTGIVASPVNLSNATLSSSINMFIGAPSVYGETNALGIACGAAANNSCVADWTIDFLFDVMNLSLSSFGVAEGDNVTVFAYLNGVLQGFVGVTSQTVIDMSSFGVIDSLFFDDSSTVNLGIGFGDFSFEAAPVNEVPLPAALPLLAAGLGAMGFMGWRKKRKALA